MPSVAGLLRVRLARAAALVAVVVFGLQGAVQGPPAAVLAPPADVHSTIAAPDLTPAHTILPAAPAEIVRPAAQQPSPPSPPQIAAALPPAAVADSGATQPRDAVRIAVRHPAPLFYPPYSARGPPLLA